MMKFALYALMICCMSLGLNAADLSPKNHERLTQHRTSVMNDGEKIFFVGDGVEWRVNPVDMYKTSSFENAHHVIIFPANPSSDYAYILSNTETGDILEVNLDSKPRTGHLNPPPPPKIVLGYSWRFITDFYADQIYLNDYYQYRIRNTDLDQFKNWKKGNHVVIGNNIEEDADVYPLILININLNQHVVAD